MVDMKTWNVEKAIEKHVMGTLTQQVVKNLH